MKTPDFNTTIEMILDRQVSMDMIIVSLIGDDHVHAKLFVKKRELAVHSLFSSIAQNSFGEL